MGGGVDADTLYWVSCSLTGRFTASSKRMTHLWIVKFVIDVVAGAEVEVGPQHATLVRAGFGVAALGAHLTTGAVACLLCSHQQLEVWGVQHPPACNTFLTFSPN